MGFSWSLVSDLYEGALQIITDAVVLISTVGKIVGTHFRVLGKWV